MSLFLVLSLLLLATACGLQGQQEPNASLNEPLKLPYGQTVIVGDDELHLTFAEVLEDSRCPTQVNCFWSGQARIRLLAGQGAGQPTSLDFNTSPAPGSGRQVQEYAGYRIELLALEPVPSDPEEPPEPAAYSATLIVNPR